MFIILPFKWKIGIHDKWNPHVGFKYFVDDVHLYILIKDENTDSDGTHTFFKTSSWVTITTRQFSNIHVPHLIQIRCPSINILKSIMISTLRYFVIVMKMLIVYIITIIYKRRWVSAIFIFNTSLVDRIYKTSMAILNKYNS